MVKRGSYEIKKQILMVVKERPSSYAELERKVDTGFRTIKANCDELSDYGYIAVEKIERDPANGKPSFRVSLTAQGQDFLQKRKRAGSS